MKKNFLFVCNFKMNVVSVKDYKKAMGQSLYNNVVLCPNFCDIKDFAKLKKTNQILLGAQNVSEFESGAYTGEVSAKMLKSAGADFCIVGHSERKKFNFETLGQINKKIKMLVQNNITPIVCTGEDIFKGEEFATRFVLAELNELLKDVDLSKVVVAYEPIWSIGTGNVPTQKHISMVCENVKKFCNASLVLYGGSFNENNFKEIAQIKSVDGALIGGASLKPSCICKMQNELKKESI